MARKTIEVSKIKTWVNHHLASNLSVSTKESRLAYASLLESVLHETGNYKGFNYLEWMNGGADRWHADGCPKDKTPYLGDETRRVYF